MRVANASAVDLSRIELIDGGSLDRDQSQQAIAYPDGPWLHEDTHATSVAIDHVDVESTPCSRGCDHLNRELLGMERS
jgi:hypothetical protein